MSILLHDYEVLAMQSTQDSNHVTTDEGVIRGNVDRPQLENVGSGVRGCDNSSVTGLFIYSLIVYRD